MIEKQKEIEGLNYDNEVGFFPINNHQSTIINPRCYEF